jgi:hypothetical protein
MDRLVKALTGERRCIDNTRVRTASKSSCQPTDPRKKHLLEERIEKDGITQILVSEFRS